MHFQINNNLQKEALIYLQMIIHFLEYRQCFFVLRVNNNTMYVGII